MHLTARSSPANMMNEHSFATVNVHSKTGMVRMPQPSTPADPIAAIQAQPVAARRTQILDAATRVFASKGFNRATIRDVAQAAGVADGTIYHYFANKADLLFGLLDRLNDTERRPASLAQAAEAPFADYFRAYLRQRVEAL